MATLRLKRLRRRLWRLFWTALIAIAVLTLLANRWVINSTDAYVYRNWALLPENDVGLVLGTSPFTGGGKPNPHFYGRIEAAVQLYQIGKIRHIIVSGANPDETYNEPRQMRKELVKAGIPDNVITMDFAGLRTLDSITRAHDVFGLDRITVITQEYHAYRAVFIGKKINMRIAAYAAPGPGPGFQPYTREIFARVKAVLDLFVLRTRPKFLGEPQSIDLNKSGSAGSGDSGGSR
ncbi:MAG: SanA protein [Hydrocarboniphaga sp.]|uniref:SanA/YdcF family protein n=1 Tax=Hydrocarboniphaga sp. TaxID=2033016 RepID=UPI0026208367|nr:ElyC/SanA/YdcF family protein [Hydrocarboniphaga sp.]MDB5970328.1 SanA protein [Hydrocarboniphaga sp.]